MSTLLIAIILTVIEVSVMLGVTYLIMNYVVPATTRQGFSFNRGFWPSIGAVAVMTFGASIGLQLLLKLLYMVMPVVVLNIVYNPWYSLFAQVLASSLAIFLTGKFLPNLVSVRSYWTALGAAVVTKVVLTLLGLFMVLVITAITAGASI